LTTSESFPPLRYESLRVARRLFRHPRETLVARRALARWFRSPFQVLRFRAWRGPPALAALDLRDGRTLHLRAGTDDKAILDELVVADLYRLDDFLTPRLGCVVDIGAHAGVFTMLVAPFATRVVCLEPEPGNRAVLERNVSFNGLGHVVVRPWGVGAGDGELTLRLDPEHNSCHSAFAGGQARGGRLTIRSLGLASLLEQEALTRIDLLKLDCEGGEHDFLGAAPDAALARVGRIRCECHTLQPPDRGDAATLGSRLERAGFRVTHRPAGGAPDAVTMLFAERS
jgi:FkbM family methyltransferase